MDLKKLVAITDHFPNCASPRKKVVSGFGVGFVSFFVFLFILSSNSCFKNPNSDNKVFILGFNITNNSSLTHLQQNPKILVQPNASNLDLSLRIMKDSGKGDNNNSGGNVKNGSFNEISAKVDDFKDTHLIKLKDVEIGNGSGKSDGLDEDHGKRAQKLGRVSSSFEECDIFDGRWVKDDTKPYYLAGSCPYVDKDINCHLNMRPDDEFVKWRWQPYGCEIPSLNATDFLERLRGKKMVFVGESLNRNMWESLVCILRHSLENKTRVYEISGRAQFKKRGIYAF